MNARDERIASLIRDIEEGRTHMISKEEGLSAAHEMLKKARSERSEGISQLGGTEEEERRDGGGEEDVAWTFGGRCCGDGKKLD